MSVDEKQSEGVGGGVAVTSIHGNIPYNRAVIYNKRDASVRRGSDGMFKIGMQVKRELSSRRRRVYV